MEADATAAATNIDTVLRGQIELGEKVEAFEYVTRLAITIFGTPMRVFRSFIHADKTSWTESMMRVTSFSESAGPRGRLTVCSPNDAAFG